MAKYAPRAREERHPGIAGCIIATDTHNTHVDAGAVVMILRLSHIQHGPSYAKKQE